MVLSIKEKLNEIELLMSIDLINLCNIHDKVFSGYQRIRKNDLKEHEYTKEAIKNRKTFTSDNDYASYIHTC